jgi:hypothetical protein
VFGPRSSHAFPHIGDRRQRGRFRSLSLPSACAAHNKSLIPIVCFPFHFRRCACAVLRAAVLLQQASKAGGSLARRACGRRAARLGAKHCRASGRPSVIIHPGKRRRTRRGRFALSIQPLAVAVQVANREIRAETT